jgi:hydroxyacylglutathione hydrolase
VIQNAGAARNIPRVIVLHTRNGPMRNYNYLVVDPSSLRAVIVDPAWEIEKIDRAVADA